MKPQGRSRDSASPTRRRVHILIRDVESATADETFDVAGRDARCVLKVGLGGRHMNNGLTLVAFVAVWYLLQVWLLPRLGVPT